ncbi:MAG TPA: VWA domain-containing protein [Myxococcota bacterium]|nr:VWA domain-containing protein [Myxococcota bacterium]
MTRVRYSRWDGTQRAFSLAAEAALDELARHLMEGMSVEEALSWMRYQGFELAGMDFRVLGVEELLQQLRQQARERMAGHNMERTFDERWEKLREILEREERAQSTQHGVESQRWTEFKKRKDALPRRLSEAVKRFADHDWADADAEADFRELEAELDAIRALEEFHARNRQMLRGGHSLSFDEALELMREVERLGRLARNLLEGRFEQISLDELREIAGDEGVESILILRDMRQRLEEGGFVRAGDNGLELTPRAIRRIGELALEDIYGSLKRGAPGGHATLHRGGGPITIERSKPYVFGEPAHLDAVATVRNALLRDPSRARVPLALAPGDLQVWDTDQQTDTTTVLLLDMSWSMSWSGRWPAAKRVAIAMDQLIRTRYPRDRFFIVGFYTRARELTIPELPELVWNMEDPFTNLQDGLRVAQRLIDRNPSANKQIIVITDGQPTAYFVGDELRVEWPSGVGGTSPRANRETLAEVSRVTRKGITINTFMLDDSPELMRFVEAMTRINKGRAFYTTPGQIGEYVMVDYLSRKRRKIR